jgi:hypothetical protein
MRILALAAGVAVVGMTVALATAFTTTTSEPSNAPTVAVQTSARSTTSPTAQFLAANATAADCTLFVGDSDWFLDTVVSTVTEPQLIRSEVQDYMSEMCGAWV